MCSGFEAMEDKGFRYLEAECCFVRFCIGVYAVSTSCGSSHLFVFVFGISGFGFGELWIFGFPRGRRKGGRARAIG